MMVILWFSCGAASAVACKMALEKYPEARIVYQHIGSAHEDNARFLADCERWYDRKIEIIQSRFYTDQFHVIKATRYINGPKGARCTTELKKKLRKYFELQNTGITTQIFGFTAEEQKRADKPEMRGFTFPLIERGIYKAECYQILNAKNIELPAMYRIGFNNNNCIGCVKGGMGYWNRIRISFPDCFEKMAKLEREIGHSCLKECFLDELDPNRGEHDEPEISCDLFCYAEKELS